jgi:hypothetical protein
MKIKSIMGWEGSYIKFEVEEGSSYYCQGDQVWCGEDTEALTGQILMINESMTREEIQDWAKETELQPSQTRVLLGMLNKTGVIL